MSLVTFEDASVRYRTQREGELALDSVSVAIDRGSFVGVTGPSEAGKSTLLRTIASYVPNYFTCDLDGMVTVDGVPAGDRSIAEMSAEVGLLFENPFDQLTGATTTVVEEVAYGLENQGLPRETIMDRTYEALERVGIVDLMDRNPYELSGGQSQRVALASILALEPEILLLDEPTSQLDPSGTEEVFDVVDAMATEEYTTIVVSQDLERLGSLVDRLLVLEGGRVRDDGDPRSVLTGPAGDEGLFAVPEVVDIGTRLREAGLVDPGRPIPLAVDAAVSELRDRASASVAGADPGPASASPSPGDRHTGGEGGNGAAADPPSGEAPIVFEDVTYAYDGIEALRGISLAIGPGCTCVVGQNGAGKSTFAKHLNGLLEPDEGRVTIGGQDTRTRRVAQLARTVGLSFQNPDNQLFQSSVAKEVRYGPANLGYDPERTEALARDAIELMALGDVAGKNPYDLGLAGRKRVAVASVLAMDTDVVVLDEPTGGQDVVGTRLLGDAIESLVADGRTVVVITHDVSFARDHADRVIALRQGEVLLDDDPRSVFGHAETLARTEVRPPTVTTVGQRLGLGEPVLTVDELFRRLA